MAEHTAQDMRDFRVCIDRTPPPKGQGERMALVKEVTWQSGDVITIGFLDGDPDVQERVRKTAEEWEGYANLKLRFGDVDDADIRISFEEQGSWSYLGTVCRRIGSGEPTMNYGWLTPDSSDDEVNRVVLHEFGHALGCIHEHQNPAGGIKWNKPVVYAYYGGPPNNWTKEQVDTNLFALYEEELTVHTEFDPHSIMLYPIDKRFTLDGMEVDLNTVLSERDKEFIRETYP